MGLTSPLIPPLFCLLACAGSFVHGHRCGVILTESIKTLNVLTESKNTSEKETFCRAATALRRFYSQRQDGVCGGAAALPRLHSHPHVIKLLKGLDRNLCSMAHASHCPVSEAKQSTLRDFLERLKTILKEKYSKCRS
ncbi:PREDICTED: interleukin-4 isoform X2 [Propithecus coquereli]|uniref:Interleukin-4 n=1 Tax=Propithecus coquereli TaxID=379532 RepID=A0A2K6FUD8_PROCO|nr:PREDICTED: interleukin-4 isoform X2 [Propithecus coquereli]